MGKWGSNQIEAEALPEISESFDVESVPFFVILRVSLISLHWPVMA